ncbi:6797_t:CDS:2, partial [Funneliformis mosseae]
IYVMSQLLYVFSWRKFDEEFQEDCESLMAVIHGLVLILLSRRFCTYDKTISPFKQSRTSVIPIKVKCGYNGTYCLEALRSTPKTKLESK